VPRSIFSDNVHAVGGLDQRPLIFGLSHIRFGLALLARRMAMPYRSLIGAVSLFAAQCVTIVDAQTWDDTKYPDLKGQWVRAEGAGGVGRFDPTKPPGRLQEAPLTAEYQAIYEANLADQASPDFHGRKYSTPRFYEQKARPLGRAYRQFSLG
jgi:hypothetical protein